MIQQFLKATKLALINSGIQNSSGVKSTLGVSKLLIVVDVCGWSVMFCFLGLESVRRYLVGVERNSADFIWRGSGTAMLLGKMDH